MSPLGILDKFEQRVKKMVDGTFAKAFESDVQPVEIAAALQKEMDERAAVVSRERTVVPGQFTVHLASADYERLAVYTQALTAELADMVREYAAEQRYAFLGPVSVSLAEDAEQPTGIFHVASQVSAAGAATSTPPSSSPAPSRAAPVGGQPHLIAAGQLIPLSGPSAVLGRGTEVDVRLEDPGVSRRHAEIILGTPSVVQDLGSTNGTLVDGVRVARAELADGSVIRLGSTDITYRVS